MKISPSILNADFTNLKNEIKSIEKEADFIHIDIMDGHFVPNISFGPSITKQVSKITNTPLDIHLMVSNPLDWIDLFNFETTKYITVHVESKGFVESIKKIKSLGIKAGVSLRPKTSLELIKPFLNEIDLILIMGVEPGFGGQSFIMSQLDRIKELNDLKISNKYNYEIEVDGGINETTAKLCEINGATILVAGTFIFKHENRANQINLLK